MVRVAVRLDKYLPKLVESDMKLLQGKGWGADSVDFEAYSSIKILSNLGIINPIILDIGANIGTYSAEVLRLLPEAKIYAFEPSTIARSQLQTRFLNDPRIRIYPFAISDVSGSAKLWSDFAGSGLASLSRRKLDHFNLTFEHEETVQLITLDEWNLEVEIEPDLVKIDVEGHELNVLNGATSILKSAKVIQFEFGGCNIDTRTYFQDFWYFFTQYNFRIFRIEPAGPVEIQTYNEADECFLTTNYLAVRSEDKIYN